MSKEEEGGWVPEPAICCSLRLKMSWDRPSGLPPGIQQYQSAWGTSAPQGPPKFPKLQPPLKTHDVVQRLTVSSRECVPRTIKPLQWHSRQPHMVSFRGSPTPLWSSNIVLHAADPSRCEDGVAAAHHLTVPGLGRWCTRWLHESHPSPVIRHCPADGPVP